MLSKFLLVGLPQALLVRAELYATHPMHHEQSMTRDVMEAARFWAENYADDRMPCIDFYILIYLQFYVSHSDETLLKHLRDSG